MGASQFIKTYSGSGDPDSVLFYCTLRGASLQGAIEGPDWRKLDLVNAPMRIIRQDIELRRK